MGRPGCSSCCEVLAPPKTGCEHVNFEYAYKVGGEWLYREEYLDALEVAGNTSGHLDLQNVVIFADKDDFGEYRTVAKGWVFPTGFGDDNEAFKDGNQDQGVHLPKAWTVDINDVGTGLTIKRSITGKSERVHYVNGHFLGFKDKQGNKECGSYGGPIRDDQGRSWREDLQVYLDGLADDIKTVLQVKTTKFMVDWATDIVYAYEDAMENFHRDTIYREKKCFHYKTTWELFDRGNNLNFAVLEEKLIDHEGCGGGGGGGGGETGSSGTPLDPDGDPTGGAGGASGGLSGFVEEYGTFNYCLTYPFFSHDGDTYYFPSHDILDPGDYAIDLDELNSYTPGEKLNTFFPVAAPNVATIQDDKWGACDARGTNDWYLDAVGPGPDIIGKEGPLHHANHTMFNSIIVESEDFIVFNPYSDTWRNVTADEFKNYDSSCASAGEPLFNGIVPPTNRKELEENLEIKEKLVSAPTFIFVDNKLRSNEYDIPQVMYAEDEANSSRLPYYEVDGGKLSDTGLAPPGTVIELFKYLALKGVKEGEEDLGAPLRDHVIVVHMRSNNSVHNWQQFGNTIEVGDKVYHPIGGCDQFTVDGIETVGQNTKPLTVKLSNDQIVGVHEIEAVNDNVSYAMNGRTYYLQKTYLKDDFSDPFKYKVKRIDLRNPHADVRVGREIAQFGFADDDPYLYVNPTYIELTTTDSWSSIPDEYFEKDPSDTTYWSISGDGCGGAEPFKIKDLIGPPKELFDGQITFTSPVGFKLKQAPPKPETYEEKFASRGTTHPNFDESCSVSDTGTMWVITIKKDEKESNTFVEMPVDDGGEGAGEGGGGPFKKEIEFDNKQLPDNGYLFGPYIELKFYLEEI